MLSGNTDKKQVTCLNVIVIKSITNTYKIMTKEELINDDHDGLNIPETKDEQWFIDMLNEPDSEPEEYYERSNNPEYIVASTSYDANETYLFEGDADGNILSFDEYGGLAERWGDENWQNPDDAVRRCMIDSYHLVKKTDTRNGCHYLFRLIAPNELDYFDGDESDRISY